MSSEPSATGVVEELGDLRVQAVGEVHAAAVDADDRERRAAGSRVALDDLVRHPNDRARDIVAVEHDLFRCIQRRPSFLASRDRVKGSRQGL